MKKTIGVFLLGMILIGYGCTSMMDPGHAHSGSQSQSGTGGGHSH